MIRNRSVIQPDMIVLARESRDMTQHQLANALGITQSYVCKLEMGLTPAKEEMLVKVSQVLSYPVDFFLQTEPLLGRGLNEIMDTTYKTLPRKSLNRLYAQIEVRYRHIQRLLKAVDMDWTIPQVDLEDYEYNCEKIAELARARLHASRGPILDITQLVEEAGLIVVPFDFHMPHVDAITRFIPPNSPVVFVNSVMSKDHYRYVVARELGHLIMYANPQPDAIHQAQQFAYGFLMPEYDIKKQLQDLDLSKLATLKQYWKVSMTLLLKRAKDIEAITENHYRYLFQQMSKLGYKKREPIELDIITGEQPSLVNEFINLHQKDLGYSNTELSQLLLLNEDEMKSMYFSTKNGLHLVRSE